MNRLIERCSMLDETIHTLSERIVELTRPFSRELDEGCRELFGQGHAA